MKYFISIIVLVCSLSSYANEEVPKYNRKLVMPHGWIDKNHDGQDTRQEVLERDSILPVTYDENGDIIAGVWRGYLTHKLYFSPTEVDIEHVVPGYVMWYSGGWSWPIELREAWMNDLNNPGRLTIAESKVNRHKKGKHDACNWQPFRKRLWCGFAIKYVLSKSDPNYPPLGYTQCEIDKLLEMLMTCPAEIPLPKIEGPIIPEYYEGK